MRKDSATATSLPSHIVLETDRGNRLAGSVLAADADLISTLEVEGVKWRAATERERAIAAV